MNKALFERTTADPASATTRILQQSGFARSLAKEPQATSYIYDTLALAYLVDASYATDVVEPWVDGDVNWGPSYGRALGCGTQPPANLLQKAKIGRRFDNTCRPARAPAKRSKRRIWKNGSPIAAARKRSSASTSSTGKRLYQFTAIDD